MRKFLFLFLALAACQTAQQRSVSLVEDRIAKLKPLSSYRPTWCQVETRLTQPAVARYRQMFPGETDKLLQEFWGYTWKSRETTCEITPLDSSPVTENHQAFLETSLCLLMQVYFVNSPFDELALLPANIEALGKITRIKTGDNPELGIFLPRDTVTVETRTKTRGVLAATYQNRDGLWLPSRLEQHRAGTIFAVDEIEYAPGAKRPQLKSFWISVGAEQPLRHSQVTFTGCRDL